MTRLITAVLARNEATRYLPRVLAHCRTFSDDILLLDDGSTDATRDIARDAGCIVRERSVPDAMWGAEGGARRELWNAAVEVADGGWVLVCDADMLLQGDVRALTWAWDVAAWAFPLVDLWDSERTYRVDGAWGYGPRTPRPWLFKPSAAPAGFQPAWSTRGVHCGHAPANWHDAGPCLLAPSDVYWHHLGWIRAEDRRVKHEAYMRVATQLTAEERSHADSIIG